MAATKAIEYDPQYGDLTIESVLYENYSFTEHVNSIQQLIAYYLITGTKVDIGKIIYSDLVTRITNKSRQKYVSYPRFVSFALEVLLVFSGQTAHPQDTERNIQLTVKGSHSPLDEGIHKSKPLPEGKPTDAKDLKGSIQPAGMGLPATPLDEGTSKSKPLHEGKMTDPKDSEGNK
ncbi:hypothetical protein Tco_0553459 [Tanacetum coccineum]